MGKILLIISSFLFIRCQNIDSNSRSIITDTTSPKTSKNKMGSSFTNHYKNEQFGIETIYPEDWVAIEKRHPTNEAAINILPADRQPKSEFPLSVHADESLSFISIWPEGFGTELPSGASKTFQEEQPALSLHFKIKPNESQVFLLENGKPWAYFLKPEAYPAQWTNGGFIFAQIRIKDLKTSCFDKKTGTKKDMSKCDPLTGDKVVREGTIDDYENQVIHQILKELKLK